MSVLAVDEVNEDIHGQRRMHDDRLLIFPPVVLMMIIHIKTI
jgi:hypothetical protein